MRRIKLMEAADLARKSYGGPAALPPLRAKSQGTGAQAYLTMDDVLVIPGTNEASDWSDYNLKAFHVTGKHIGWSGANPAIGEAKWHFGFAVHALEVLRFMADRQPKAIVGHSLGAASAQILGCHYQVPTVTFAAPRPHLGAAPMMGEGWVINLVHTDDIISLVLAEAAGFRRLGSVRNIPPDSGTGIGHKMADYMGGLTRKIADGSLSAQWPPAPGQ